jgi:ankyrin repeat protein
LQYAIVKSSDELILELLNAGADANGVLGEEGGTPLVMAAYNGNSTLAHLLLERGALINPETLSGSYGDPLCAAIQNENEALIDLFLDKGAGLGRTGDKYDPPLHCAAKRGDIVTVRKLIGRGADVNHVSGRYATALRAALAFGHNEVANYLLNNGADPNIIVKGKHSTLFYQHSSEEFDHAFEVAVATNNTSTVQVLLNSGFDLNSSEQAAVRALKYSLMMLEATMLEYLVAKGIDVAKFGGKSMNVNRWSKDSEVLKKIKLMLSKGAILPKGNEGLGNTLLLTSIDRQEWELLDFLLDAGCDPNITYDGGNLQGSPLNEAVKGEHMDAITKLLAKGANVNLHAGMWGTPFVNAIAKGDEELYRLFLEHGAAVNSPPSGAFGSPLDVAISKGYYDFAHDLIDRGADVHGASSYGSLLTPACHGGSVGQMAMVRRLLTLGVDVNAEDARRPGDNSNRLYQTPFQAAIRGKNDELLKLLLEHGAKINPDEPQGSYGYPLQTAVRYAYEDQTRLLLEHGADVNAIGGEYGTALQAAAAESSDALIKLLLESGADVTIEGGYYGSALQAACRRGIVRHVKLFLEKGAPVNTNCGKYGSPLAAAAKRAEKEVVEILLDAGADVNQTGGKYGTPLQAACCAKGSTAKRHGEDTIKLLLERGAKVNTQDVGKYGSPIQAAAFHNKGYTKILLAHGAAVFVEGGKYRTAAKAAHAAKAFHTEKLLMEHGKA